MNRQLGGYEGDEGGVEGAVHRDGEQVTVTLKPQHLGDSHSGDGFERKPGWATAYPRFSLQDRLLRHLATQHRGIAKSMSELDEELGYPHVKLVVQQLVDDGWCRWMDGQVIYIWVRSSDVPASVGELVTVTPKNQPLGDSHLTSLERKVLGLMVEAGPQMTGAQVAALFGIRTLVAGKLLERLAEVGLVHRADPVGQGDWVYEVTTAGLEVAA